MTVGEILKQFTKRLADEGSPSARLDSELLIGDVLNLDRSKLLTSTAIPVSSEQEVKLHKILERRLAGEPIAYILGEKDFYKDKFKVGPGVLVPRPETEIIVEEALAWLKDRETVRVLDLGCGSGCIGLSILRDFTRATLVGIDISPVAISYSQENAKRLALEARSQFVNANANEVNYQDVDLVVANPPYIDPNDLEKDLKSLNFEPKEALYSEDGGFADIAAWLMKAAVFLKTGGMLLMEIGADQEDRATNFLSQKKLFSSYKIIKDLAGKPRTIRAIK